MHETRGLIRSYIVAPWAPACAAMTAPDWRALLEGLFHAKGDPDALGESKALKKALKKAAKGSEQGKEQLAASLKAFLAGWVVWKGWSQP